MKFPNPLYTIGPSLLPSLYYLLFTTQNNTVFVPKNHPVKPQFIHIMLHSGQAVKGSLEVTLSHITKCPTKTLSSKSVLIV